jgi:hypothetical protein
MNSGCSATKRSKPQPVDEPLRLEGEAADRFLDEMERPDTSEERKKFLEECDRVYRKTQEKIEK